jgi:hypothetical protein
MKPTFKSMEDNYISILQVMNKPRNDTKYRNVIESVITSERSDDKISVNCRKIITYMNTLICLLNPWLRISFRTANVQNIFIT